MAVPRKTSKARRDKRRANWKVSMPGMTDAHNAGLLAFTQGMQGM